LSSYIDKSLTSDQNKELRRLKRTRSRRIMRACLLLLVVALIGLHFKKHVFINENADLNIESARKILTHENTEWPAALSHEQLSLEEWLKRRGTGIEIYLFDKASALLFISAVKSLPLETKTSDLGIFEGFYLSMHFGILRIAFILIACFRLWLIIIAFSLYRGMRFKKAYAGPDMMGETGNSRLFYSGIRAGLENLNEIGAPNKQVTGLACPKKAEDTKLRSSNLYRVLEKFGVANATNSALAAIIVEYEKFPSYIPPQEEEKLYSEFVEKGYLAENSAVIIEKILDLHSFYAHAADDSEFLAYLEDFEAPKKNVKLSLEQYGQVLQKSLHRALTPEMREVVSALPLSHICTLALSLEAGKVMVFAYEGERWHRKSNYPQLCARSVLHSIEAFSREHNFNERTVIRQAMIYSSRSGDFGPVKLPVDLSDEARALRQWSEILTANPHDVENTANDVEMYGIVFESHKKFKQAFLDKIMVGDKEMLEGTYATMGNLFLFPFSTIYKLTKQTLTQKSAKRLEELAKLAAQKQKLKVIHTDNLVDVAEKNRVPAHSKVFEPLSEKEIKTLSDTYKIPFQSLKEWSSLRIVLNNFGWLARRVGDYSVPESSLIFAVMHTDIGTPGANELGLIGAPGMVPLRATQLEERWGKTWQTRTTQVLTSTMAENKEDFEKLMRGEVNTKEFEENTTANV
jgi:hypothetical protein